jgi:hypothetical protein
MSSKMKKEVDDLAIRLFIQATPTGMDSYDKAYAPALARASFERAFKFLQVKEKVVYKCRR